MEVIELTNEEIKQRIDSDTTGEFINQYLSGNVRISEESESEEPVSKSESNTDTMVQTQEESGEGSEEKKSENFEEIRRQLFEEIREKERKLEEESNRREQERQRYLEELAEAKAEAERIRSERAEMENRVRNTTEETKEIEFGEDADNPDYASDYSRKNRALIQEFERKYGRGDPILSQLKKQTESLENRLRKYEESQSKIEKKNKEEGQRRKVFDSVRRFQESHKDFETTKDIEAANQSYVRFLGDVMDALKVDRERAHGVAERYFNGELDESHKKVLDKYGITAGDDERKVHLFKRLMDLKNGRKFDPIADKYTTVTDEFGNKVTYRNLEEVYRLENFDKIVNDIRRENNRAINNKINDRRSGAVTLPSTDTTSVDHNNRNATKNRLKELIAMDPSRYSRNGVVTDKELYRQVSEAFRLVGAEPPRLRIRS